MAASTASAPDLLVIGGSGLLGRALLATGAALEVSIHATGWRHPSGAGAHWHRLDLGDGGEGAARLIAAIRPRAIVNAAYVQSGDGLEAITAVAPGVIARAAREVGARFVHISSDVVFDGEKSMAYVESDPLGPVHAYGEAKARAEELVAHADPGAVLIRTSLLWSTEADGGPQVRLVRDPAVRFFTDEIRSPIRVDRLAATIHELSGRREISGALHVAGIDAVDRLEFAQLLAPLVGRRADELRGEPGDPNVARPRRLALDTTLARSLLSTPLVGIKADRPGSGLPSR